MALGDLDSISLGVGADISAFTAAMSEIPQVGQRVAGELQAGFDAAGDPFAGLDVAVKNVNGALSQLSTEAQSSSAAVKSVGDSTTAASEDMTRLSQSVQQANAQVNNSVSGWQSLTPALQNVGGAATQAAGGMSQLGQAITSGLGIGTGLEILQGFVSTIKELGEAAIGTFSQIERSTLALTALTGSVDTANSQIEHLKSLAVSEALSFPELVSANQRMIAMGFSTAQTNSSLQAAANASAATGVNLVLVTNSLERMSESGSVAARQLATLGLSMQDLAKAEGTTTENAKAMFQSLDPSGRIDVLIAALNKYQGTAEALVASLSGQFQQLKNQILFALEPIGEAVAPMLKQIMTSIQTDALPALQSLVQAFKDVGSVVGPLATGIITGLTQNVSDLVTVITHATSEAINLGVAFVNWETGAKNAKTSTSDLNISLSDFLRYGQAVATLGLSEGIHALSVEFHLVGAEVDLATEALKRHKQALENVTGSIKDFIDNQAKAANTLLGVRLEFEKQQKALADAKANLDLVQQAYDKGFASLGQLKAAQEAYDKALYDMDPAAKTAADAAKKLADAIDAIVSKSRLLLQELPTNITEVQHAFDTTGETVKSDLSKVESELQNLKNKMIEIGGATTDMLKTWGNLQQARDQLKLLAAEQAWTQIKQQIADLTTAMNKGSGATDDQLKEMAKLQQKLQDAADAVTKLGGTVTQLAQDSSGKWHEVTGPIQQANDAIQVINGNMGVTAQQAAFAAQGITFLTTSTNQNTTATKGASAAQTELGTVFQTTGEKARAAAEQAAGMAKAMENVAAAAKDAADSMEAALSASDALAHSFAVTGFGGGPGGSASPGGQIGLKPGDVITQRGEAGQIISQLTVPGSPQAKLYDVNGRTMLLTPDQAQMMQDWGDSVTAITKHLNTATQAVADLGNAATQVSSTITDVTSTISDAVSTTADAIVTAAQTITDATATATNGITSLVVPVIQAVQTAVATVMGSNSTTLLGPSTPSVPSAPSFSNAPSTRPSNTLVTMMPQNTGAFSPYVSGHPPANVNVNINVASGGMEAAQQLVQTLQSMGVRVN